MPLPTSLAAALVLALAAVAGAADSTPPAPSGAMPPAGKLVTTDSGLQYADIIQGKGAMPQEGDVCIVHYTGWLDDGKQFDTSRTRDKPFGFELGKHQVIRGWEEGVATMQVGGTRRLLIPSRLGYGERGVKGIIPPNARLTFEIELLRLQKPAKTEPPVRP
jgi:peptidylprolyl isomerase